MNKFVDNLYGTVFVCPVEIGHAEQICSSITIVQNKLFKRRIKATHFNSPTNYFVSILSISFHNEMKVSLQ